MVVTSRRCEKFGARSTRWDDRLHGTHSWRDRNRQGARRKGRARADRAAGASFVTPELLGHPSTLLGERALRTREGRVYGRGDPADGPLRARARGTLFLDEVGELKLDSQPKLLRLLQEREFERSAATRRSARRPPRRRTHRDLGKMCEMGRSARTSFTASRLPDPPAGLRERREDIPSWCAHFVSVLAERMRKDLRRVSAASDGFTPRLRLAGQHPELQNVLERAVILAIGRGARSAGRSAAEHEARCPDPFERNARRRAARAHPRSAREHPRRCRGPQRAAARLGINRSTLLFRMKKLGIPHGAAARRYKTGAPPLIRAVNG